MIVDYRGQVMNINYETQDAFVTAPFNMHALRTHRTKSMHLNWLPQIKSEIFRMIYDKEMWPKNMAIDKAPERREAIQEVYRQTIDKLVKDGTFVSPEE
jgi:hypothetical protein